MFSCLKTVKIVFFEFPKSLKGSKWLIIGGHFGPFEKTNGPKRVSVASRSWGFHYCPIILTKRCLRNMGFMKNDHFHEKPVRSILKPLKMLNEVFWTRSTQFLGHFRDFDIQSHSGVGPKNDVYRKITFLTFFNVFQTLLYWRSWSHFIDEKG